MAQDTSSPPKPAFSDDEDATALAEFKPLSAEEARQWREQHPPLSPWRIVAWQAGVGGVAAGLTWWLSGRGELAGSVGYGALAVVLPAGVLARAMSRQAGAATELGNDALLINPFDVSETAAALDEALSMPQAERARRCARLAESAAALPPQTWFDQQVRALGGVPAAEVAS